MQGVQVGDGRTGGLIDPFTLFDEEELKDNPYLLQACRETRARNDLDRDAVLKRAKKIGKKAKEVERIRQQKAEQEIAETKAQEKEAEAKEVKKTQAQRIAAAQARARKMAPDDQELQKAVVDVQEAFLTTVIADDRKRLMDRYTGNLVVSAKVMLAAVFLPIMNMLSDFIGHWPLGVCGLLLGIFMLRRMKHIEADFKEAMASVEDGKPIPDKGLVEYIKKHWRHNDEQR